MPRSVGEAAALGLESGYRLAVDAQERQARQERQLKLDAQAAENQSYVRGRQARADKVQALGLQGQQLAQEGIGLQQNPNATPEDRAAFTDRVQRFTTARDATLAEASGLNLEEQTKLGQDEIVRLQQGDVQGVNLRRATAVATGRPHTDYLRTDGQPSVVEQAAENMLKGMESGDTQALLQGANTMYAPELRKGVGSPSPHGGVIVGKQIVGLERVPGDHPDDPHFVPRLRVYVNNGKQFRGPVPEGVPPGATSYYDAPLTKNRSSDPNDPVRPIGLNETIDWLHKQQQIVEALNTPEAQQKLAEDGAGFDDNAYFQALTSVGAAGGKGTVKDELVKPLDGGPAYKVRTEYDARGNPKGAPKRIDIEGNQGTAKPRPRGEMASTIAGIDALVEDGTLTEEEGRARKRALATTKTEPKPRSAGGGGRGGSSGGNIQSTKVDNEGYVIGVFRDGSSRRLLMDGKPWKSQDFEKRIDKIAHDLSQDINGLGKSQSELRSQARDAALEGVKGEEPSAPSSAAPAKKVIKYDKDGKRVS